MIIINMPYQKPFDFQTGFCFKPQFLVNKIVCSLILKVAKMFDGNDYEDFT
jgi:hypothetical protein